jgi:hypothetical protein
VSGGTGNTAGGDDAAVAGGQSDTVTGVAAALLGGKGRLLDRACGTFPPFDLLQPGQPSACDTP